MKICEYDKFISVDPDVNHPQKEEDGEKKTYIPSVTEEIVEAKFRGDPWKKKPTRYIHVSELNKGPKKRREKLPVRYSPSQKNDQYRSSEKGQIGEGDGNM